MAYPDALWRTSLVYEKGRSSQEEVVVGILARGTALNVAGVVGAGRAQGVQEGDCVSTGGQTADVNSI